MTGIDSLLIILGLLILVFVWHLWPPRERPEVLLIYDHEQDPIVVADFEHDRLAAELWDEYFARAGGLGMTWTIHD